MHFKTFTASAVALALPALAQQDDMMSLLDLMANTDELSTLASIVTGSDRALETLGNANNVTVFAPTNAAFQTLMETTSLTDLTEDDVAAVLYYHAVSGMIYAENITTMPMFLNTMLTDSMYTNVTDGQALGLYMDENDTAIVQSGYKSRAQVVQADVMFDGGIVHLIDSVNMIPQDVVSTAIAANLSYFTGALIKARLVADVADLMDVTIFAPSNAAFEDLGDSLNDVSVEDLASVLQYHIIDGTVAYSSMLSNSTVMTLGGSDVNITVADEGVFINSARVINADVLVSSGVVHIIDSVLNPDSMMMPDLEDEEAQPAFSTADGMPAFTSGVPVATTTVSELITTTLDVTAEETAATDEEDASSSDGAAPTALSHGAIEMAALMGGAAFALNW